MPPEMIGARVAGEPRNIKSSRSSLSFISNSGPNQGRHRIDSASTRAARRSRAYSALLLADDYCEGARQALRDGDDAAARHSLSVIRGLAEAALTQIPDRQVRP